MQWHAKSAAGRRAEHQRVDVERSTELGRVSPNLPWRAFEILSKDNPVLSHVVAFRSTYRITALIRGQGSAVEGLYVYGRVLRRARERRRPPAG